MVARFILFIAWKLVLGIGIAFILFTLRDRINQ
jgi:hypothetical protein